MSFIERLKKVRDEALNAVTLAPEEVATERFNICKACPELKAPLNICSQCGCLMGAKTKLKNVNCPLGKW
jgi:hypothetical protein